MAEQNRNTATADASEGMSIEDAKRFFADAQKRATEAVHAALDAVKDNPKAAAAIATGAAAAVAAGAFGVAKLREGGAATKGGDSAKK